ncbi:hypothetical protein C8R46DRAFT_1026066 [Mycena filopes]|nr:hypothetical protein C8R46DRAFT_1026066 [Mycena filopes]
MATHSNPVRKKTGAGLGLGHPATTAESEAARARLRSQSQNVRGSSSRGGLSANPLRPPFSSASTPTAASRARHVDAATPDIPPFGAIAPRAAIPIAPVIFSRIQQGTPRPARVAAPQSSASMANTEGDATLQEASALEGTTAQGTPVDGSSLPLSSLTSLSSHSPHAQDVPLPGSHYGGSRHGSSHRSGSRFSGSRSSATGSTTSSRDSRGHPRSEAPQSTAAPPSAQGESVTAAFSALGGNTASRFFKKSGRSIELYDEPLSAAVARYHFVYDPQDTETDDSLLYYGVVDGQLPGRSVASTNLLRDVITRYQEPHNNFEWDNLPALIAKVFAFECSSVKVVRVINPIDHTDSYCLDLPLLAAVGHAVLAVQQILDGIRSFSTPNPRRRFEVDTNFTYLRMLEDRVSKTELRFALSVLQLRLDRANGHIRANLSGIRETLTGQAFSESVSSVVSTISEVRAAYGAGEPSQQLYRMPARKDYGRRAQVVNRTAYHQLVESVQAHENIDPRPYKSRQRHRARSNSPELDPVVEETPAPEVPASAAPAANAGYFGPISSGHVTWCWSHPRHLECAFGIGYWGAIDDTYCGEGTNGQLGS